MKIDCGRYVPTLALVAVTAFPLCDASDAVATTRSSSPSINAPLNAGQVIILSRRLQLLFDVQ